MIEEGEDDLICDLAETYGIFNYKSLPVQLVAVFSYGLREDARIWKKLTEVRNVDREIMVSILDNLNWLVWAQTEDGAHNRNRPESLYKKMFGKDSEGASDIESYSSPEEYKQAWERIRKQHGNDNC